MQNNILTGIQFYIEGFKLLFNKDLKHYLIIPIIINFLLLFLIIFFVKTYLFTYLNNFLNSYPEWLIFILGWLFTIIFWISSILISILSFSVLTNIIAAPFYGRLSEKTQNIYGSPLPKSNLWTILPRILMREGRKLIYFGPWLFLCLILFIVPITLMFAPIIWWGVMSWILAVQYVDYCADNQQISFTQMISILKKIPLTVLGFGGMVTLTMTIPGANLFVPPAAVVGGTRLWLSISTKMLKSV